MAARVDLVREMRTIASLSSMSAANDLCRFRSEKRPESGKDVKTGSEWNRERERERINYAADMRVVSHIAFDTLSNVLSSFVVGAAERDQAGARC